MQTLIVKQLTEFKEAVRRDLIVDGASRPKPMTDEEFLPRLIAYGNAYLAAAKAAPENKGVCLWFDIHFDGPDGKAVVGMTWAYNPGSPIDSLSGVPEFWRLWAETGPVDETSIFSLPRTQEDLASYLAQGGLSA